LVGCYTLYKHVFFKLFSEKVLVGCYTLYKHVFFKLFSEKVLFARFGSRGTRQPGC